VQGRYDWLASVAPAVEVASQWRRGDYVWRPYVRAGVRLLSTKSLSATASLAGAPSGIAPFTVTAPLDQFVAEVSAGFNLWKDSRYSLQLSYDGRFGAHTFDNGGTFKLRTAF